MRKKIKYFRPNKIITLIDLTKGEYPYGALIFHPQLISQPQPLKTPELPESESLNNLQKKIFELFDLINFNLLFKFILSNISAASLPYKAITLNIISAFCIVIALLGVASFSYPYFASQFNNLIPKNSTKAVVVSATTTPSPKAETTEFVLTIPKINIISDVVPEVDIRDEEIYKQELKRAGVAHAKGTFLPNGQKGPMLLFAHSTDSIIHIDEYNAKFFSLPSLEVGDEVEIQYHGTKYSYKVTDKKVVGPRDFAAIENSTSALILMTCTPPGTDWQRLLIFADKVSEKAV